MVITGSKYAEENWGVKLHEDFPKILTNREPQNPAFWFMLYNFLSSNSSTNYMAGIYSESLHGSKTPSFLADPRQSMAAEE